MRLIRHGLRLCIVVCALLGPVAWNTPQQSVASDNRLAAIPEVRLRKLHLVRPDLIPYPLCLEIVC